MSRTVFGYTLKPSLKFDGHDHQAKHATNNGHCNGIAGLVVCRKRNNSTVQVFSGSRDSSIRLHSFDMSKRSVLPRFVNAFEGHSDWISSMVLTSDAKSLVSSSADTVIRIWDPTTGACKQALTSHGDYVEDLAFCSKAGVLVSAGLSEQLYLWKLDSGMNYPAERLNDKSKSAANNRCSYYSCDISETGSLMATGASNSVVQFWDTRRGSSVFQMNGHRSTVRDILLSPDGLFCVSAGDSSIRYWDAKTRKCLAVFVMPSSVWTICINKDWTIVYAGLKNGMVTCSKLDGIEAGVRYDYSKMQLKFNPKQRKDTRAQKSQGGLAPLSEVIVELESPVLKVVLEEEYPKLWITSWDADLLCFDLAQSQETLESRRSFPAAPTPHQSFSTSLACSIHFRGFPPIRRGFKCPDQKHLLTISSKKKVLLWDLVNVNDTILPIIFQFRDYGEVDFDNLCDKQTKPDNSRRWCRLDFKLGCPLVLLESKSAFNARRKDTAGPSFGSDAVQKVLHIWAACSKPHLVSKLQTMDTENVNLSSHACDFQVFIIPPPRSNARTTFMPTKSLPNDENNKKLLSMYSENLPSWVSTELQACTSPAQEQHDMLLPSAVPSAVNM